MKYYLGLDASTQSISGIIIDLHSGAIVAEESVAFDTIPGYDCPNGVLRNDDPLAQHADPLVWLAGLEALLTDFVDNGVVLELVKAVSGSGQQHGTVYLNKQFLNPESWGSAEGDLAARIQTMLCRSTAPI